MTEYPFKNGVTGALFPFRSASHTARSNSCGGPKMGHRFQCGHTRPFMNMSHGFSVMEARFRWAQAPGFSHKHNGS